MLDSGKPNSRRSASCRGAKRSQRFAARKKDGGTWANTPLPGPDRSRLERKARLTVDFIGSIEGNGDPVQLYGSGGVCGATKKRNEDEADRKAGSREPDKADIPADIALKISNRPKLEECVQRPGRRIRFEGYPVGAHGRGQRALLTRRAVRCSGSDFMHAARIHSPCTQFSTRAPTTWPSNSGNWQVAAC